jgi:hypothetical protein
MNTIDRARAYLAKLPPAVSGNGGHRATFSAACRLVEFGLSFEQAAPLLAAWNETHCQPQWTVAELNHKLADAFKRTSVKPQFLAARNRVASASAAAQKPSVRTAGTQSKRATTQMRPSNFPKSELLQVAPRFQPGTSQDFDALAKLRGLSRAGIALASARGLLRFGRYHGTDAWFVLDASHRNGCARRMDGTTWRHTDAKSLIFRGPFAQWPIGISEAQPFAVILLCEGAPDLIAAFHFITTLGREADCAPVTMLSAYYNIPPPMLTMFAGKRVRIFAHVDATGYRAAARWQAAIEPHAREVDAFAFAGIRTRDGKAANDLNGFAQCEANDENEKLLADLLP